MRSANRINPVGPVTRFAMLMSHGDNHDRLVVDTVNKRIRKAREKEAAYFRLNLRRYSRMTLDQSHGAIKLIEEIATQAFGLLLPHDGIINFALG